ncbi:hypothetical protein C0J52_15033 [Blattella germanica]|nr:hypothetical protein C0J52_15033 [Blattella germanica]
MTIYKERRYRERYLEQLEIRMDGGDCGGVWTQCNVASSNYEMVPTYQQFKQCRTDVGDADREGRPSTSTTEYYIQKEDEIAEMWEPNEQNSEQLCSIRRETTKSLKNKEREYLKEKINDLEMQPKLLSAVLPILNLISDLSTSKFLSVKEQPALEEASANLSSIKKECLST